MTSDSTLTLFIPDLFAFKSTLSTLTQSERLQLSEFDFSILDKWLSRGEQKKSVKQKDIIFTELGLASKNSTDIPFAALMLAHEENISKKNTHEITLTPDIYWLRADPVFLQPDRDTAIIAAHEELALSQDEADTLVAEINAHFADEPWHLYALAPHRWYLHLELPHDLKTQPLVNALGQNIEHLLPAGKDAEYWLKISNEIQMLLHGTNINFERESRGKLTANSLWLWGGGCLSDIAQSQHHYSLVITDDRLISSAAAFCELDVLPLDMASVVQRQMGNSLIVLDNLSGHVRNSDIYSYLHSLHKLNADFLKPCETLLNKKLINKIILLNDSGVSVTITRKNLRHWWKRIKAFSVHK